MRPDLRVRIGNMELNNPLMTASGTCGYGDELSAYFDISLLGAVVSKSLTLKPKVGNPPPRVAEVASGMLNSIGLANIGIERFMSDKIPLLNKLGALIVANIAAKRVEDYVSLAEKLNEDESVRGLELNLSCPNVKEGGIEFGTDIKTLSTIVRLVRKVFPRTLIVKLTPEVTRITDFAKTSEDEGANAVTVANTYVGMAVDIYSRRPKIHTVTGGMSGPAVKPLTMAKVFQVSRAVKIPIVASGGIFGWRDVVEYLIAGATAVEIGTALFTKPDLPATLLADINQYMVDQKVEKISNLAGSISVGADDVPHLTRG